MVKQNVNIGSTPDDGTGDPLRTAYTKINSNTDEIYNGLGDGTSLNAELQPYTTTEQTKLAGIEAGATGDQTGAEIKAAYEAEADTNAFTDAEQTKLASLNQFLPIEAEAATAYNAVVADAGKYKRMTAATAVTFTITDAIFSAGDEIVVEQAGAGVITFTAGGGMTLNSRGGLLSTGGQYGSVTIKFISGSEAIIAGDLA